MGRSLASHGFTFLIIGLVLLVGLLDWGRDAYYGPGPLAEPKVLEIPSGARFNEITDSLADAGVVSNETVFRIGWRYSGLAGKEKAGVYEFPANATMEQVATLISEGAGAASRFRLTYLVRANDVIVRFRDLLNREAIADGDVEAIKARIQTATEEGSSIDYRVTLAEGLTSFEIVEGLKQIEFLSGELVDLPPEGSLAPDTYSFRRGQERASILSAMAAAQERIITRAWENRAPDLPINSPEEMLILASIVEKEAGGPGEWQRVASVFVNRLNQGMRLQADATIAYGLTGGKSRRGFDLTRSEIQQRTPYNTYQIDGLPPTPIGNPGRRAIEATVTPEDSEYLFFVADGTGGHAFAKTLAEHEKNVAVWRQIEAQQNSSQ